MSSSDILSMSFRSPLRRSDIMTAVLDAFKVRESSGSKLIKSPLRCFDTETTDLSGKSMSQAGAKLKRLFYHILVVLSIDSSCDCSDQHEFWGDDTDQCWDESAPDERAPNRIESDFFARDPGIGMWTTVQTHRNIMGRQLHRISDVPSP